jgi:hypothetical protein
VNKHRRLIEEVLAEAPRGADGSGSQA